MYSFSSQLICEVHILRGDLPCSWILHAKLLVFLLVAFLCSILAVAVSLAAVTRTISVYY